MPDTQESYSQIVSVSKHKNKYDIEWCTDTPEAERFVEANKDTLVIH